ncbi:MAG: sugar kinase [Rhizobiaceae bacterium]|nr:sugar kinase [Rhizobiaceae bacterium]MCV0408793.1 sugar kinase [Rhizobiaceae bacterium]
MATVLIAGLATLDFVFDVDAMPRTAEKHRARDASMIGGGGAANAAVAISRLGGRASLAVRLGDDEFAALIEAGLAGEGVDGSLIRRIAGSRSSFSSVFIDRKGERQIVNFRDDTTSTDANWISQSDMSIDAALSDTRWPEGALAAMQLARRQGRPGVIDGEAPARLALAALVAASHIAFSAQGLREFAGTDDFRDGLAKARDETGAWVCVTDGANGVAVLEEERLRTIPAFGVDAVDTLAAGDVWHGAFALALAERQGEIDAVRFANAVAAIKCMRAGGRASYPDRAAVETFLKDAA